jgi:hypothetical protein
MNGAGRVQEAQACRELRERAAQAREVERSPGSHAAEEVDAVDQLHREEPAAVVVEQLAQRYQVGMREVVQDEELVAQPVQRVQRRRTQRLHRDRAAAVVIVRGVDHAHAAAAEHALDLEAVAGQSRPGSERRHARSRRAVGDSRGLAEKRVISPVARQEVALDHWCHGFLR